MTLEIHNPTALGRPSGWNNGMLAQAGARILFVAGQSAGGESHADEGGDIIAQWGQVLDKVLAVVREAGGDAHHIARMTVYVTDIDDYRAQRKPLGHVWRERMGRHYPAMALVAVRSLVDPNAVVEIEATAVIP